MILKLNNKHYDTLKWIAMIGLPALIAFIGTVGMSLGWEHTDLTVTIMTAFDYMLGQMLGISTHNYHNDKEGA